MAEKLYDRIRDICIDRGISVRRLERDLGFADGLTRKWNTSVPSSEKLSAVAEYLEVPINYLLGKDEEYYYDPEVSRIMQSLKDKPELKALFDAAQDLTREDVDLIINMMERLGK